MGGIFWLSTIACFYNNKNCNAKLTYVLVLKRLKQRRVRRRLSQRSVSNNFIRTRVICMLPFEISQKISLQTSDVLITYRNHVGIHLKGASMPFH